MSEKLGLEAVYNLSLPEAFQFRDSLYSRNEFEEYAYWKSEQKSKNKNERKDKTDPGKKFMEAIAPSETNKDVVDHAMESADNYLAFIRSRGYFN